MREIVTRAPARVAGKVEDRHPGPPPWTQRLVGELEAAPWTHDEGGVLVRIVEGSPFSMISLRLPDAVQLEANAFRAGARRLYETLRQTLEENVRTPHPVRIWNFIPGILEPLGELPHRYMEFNAGRYEAYELWYESRANFSLQLPTATGTGQSGRHLDVHCLCAAHAGTPIENPRQVSAYRYSPRYGPLPPCFARATRLFNGHGVDWLLVGGTASVTGEDSAHLGDLAGQLEETALNLEALVRAAGTTPPIDDGAALARFEQLRVYHPRPDDAGYLAEVLAARFPSVERLETVQSDLCRPELLLEIEGVARLS